MTAESGDPGPVDVLPALESTLNTDPTARNVMRVAEVLRLAGRSARAVELLQAVVDREPSRISPRVLLAWCLEDLGRSGDASAMMETVRSLDPGNPFAREGEPARPAPSMFVTRPGERAGLAPVMPLPGVDPETAAEPELPLTERELREIPPSPLYSATLAEIFEKQGFEGKALEILEEVARLHPDRGDLQDRIVDLRAREGEGG